MPERTGGAGAPGQWDVVVVGGGCAGLTAALAARHRGRSVLLLDAGSFDRPGGNTRHASRLRLPSAPPRHRPTGRAPVSEGDPRDRGPASKDTASGHGDAVARFTEELSMLGAPAAHVPLLEATARGATQLAPFMVAHGAAFSGPYAGVIDDEPSLHYLVGGGLALVRAYRRAADRLGVVFAADAAVTDLVPGTTPGTVAGVVATVSGRAEQIDARAVIVASGGAEAAPTGGDGAAALLRGGRENTGVLFSLLGDLGAEFVGEGAHLVAVDARAPAFDGGIAPRADAIVLGVTVDRSGRRLFDGPIDPAAHVNGVLGAVVAGATGGEAAVIWDDAAARRVRPACWLPERASTVPGLAHQLGVAPGVVELAVSGSDRGPGGRLGGSPYYGMWVRPGVTFGYRGLRVDVDARVVRRDGVRFTNVFAAGEAMAGSIRPSSYRSGIGLTIAGVWGRIAARSAVDGA